MRALRYFSKIVTQTVPQKFIYLYYNYHLKFYKSLLFKGKKLKAMEFFLQLKYSVKKKTNYQPSVIICCV